MKKYTCCICAIMKNEHSDLEEWIQHHLDLGIEHIHLYEDRGSDPHDEICNKYEKVTLHKLSNEKYDFLFNLENNKQCALYNFFVLEYHNIYDFALMIDIDEYLYFNEGWDLQKLLNDSSNKSSVCLLWKVYGANGRVYPSKNIRETYTTDVTEMYEWGRNFPKVLLNLKKPLPFEFPHYTASSYGDNANIEMNYDKVWLNHYYTKSWVDWCQRFIKKGDLFSDNRQIYEFFRMNVDMKPNMDSLIKMFFEKKRNHLIENGIPPKTIKIVQHFSIIPSYYKWHNTKKYQNILFDILSLTLSFHYLRLTGREVVLYTDDESVKYVQHLDYDDIIIVPNEFKPQNGIRDSILIYALMNEDINTIFVNGSFIIGNNNLIDTIECNHDADVFINTIAFPPHPNFWEDKVNAIDNLIFYLDSCFITNNETDADYSFLSFNDINMKNELINSYIKNIELYKTSRYRQWWEMCKHMKPDTKFIGNKIGELIKDKPHFILDFIKRVTYKEKQTEERLNFFKCKDIGYRRYEPDINIELMELLKNANPNLFDKTTIIIKSYV